MYLFWSSMACFFVCMLHDIMYSMWQPQYLSLHLACSFLTLQIVQVGRCIGSTFNLVGRFQPLLDIVIPDKEGKDKIETIIDLSSSYPVIHYSCSSWAIPQRNIEANMVCFTTLPSFFVFQSHSTSQHHIKMDHTGYPQQKHRNICGSSQKKMEFAIV